MKVKNVSKRQYIHGSFSINPGAVLTVPDYIGKLWVRTGEIIEIKEIEQVIKVTEPIKTEKESHDVEKKGTEEDLELQGPQPDNAEGAKEKTKVQPKKVNKNAKRNSRRV